MFLLARMSLGAHALSLQLKVQVYDMHSNGIDRGVHIKEFVIKSKAREQMRDAGLVVDAAGAAAADAAAAGPSAASADA